MMVRWEASMIASAMPELSLAQVSTSLQPGMPGQMVSRLNSGPIARGGLDNFR